MHGLSEMHDDREQLELGLVLFIEGLLLLLLVLRVSHHLSFQVMVEDVVDGSLDVVVLSIDDGNGLLFSSTRTWPALQ